MALIKEYPDTLAGKQEKLRDLVSRTLNNQFSSVKQVVASGRDLIWHNPDGLTPQEAIDAFGTDAKQLFQASQAAISMVNAILPGTIDPTLPDGHTITINSDGTVTVVT